MTEAKHEPAPDRAWSDGHWTTVDGVRLHYRDYPGDPARTPVLCIPGLTRNARDFEGVAARLAGTRRVIAVDLRGRGESQNAHDPMHYTPSVYVQDLIGLAAALALPPVVVIGTSLGGLLAMLLGLAARPMLAGALLNDIGPVLGAEGMARIRAYVGRDARFADWPAAADAIAASHAAAFPDYSHADWMLWARRVCREEGGTIRFDYDMAIAEPFKMPAPDPAFDLWPAFVTLAGLPSVLIRGELSDVLEADTATTMKARLPEIDHVTLPRIGHAPTLEEPAAAIAIDRLLEKVDRD